MSSPLHCNSSVAELEDKTNFFYRRVFLFFKCSVFRRGERGIVLTKAEGTNLSFEISYMKEEGSPFNKIRRFWSRVLHVFKK